MLPNCPQKHLSNGPLKVAVRTRDDEDHITRVSIPDRRVTLSRSAYRSNDSTIPGGKSTFSAPEQNPLHPIAGFVLSSGHNQQPEQHV